MARSVHTLPTRKDPALLAASLAAWLAAAGFARDANGTWRRDHGLYPAPQFVRFHVAGESCRLEVWTKMTLVPGVHLGEAGPDGFIGRLPALLLRELVAALEAQI